jgi:CRP/FNR family cyclic AMP-dependent transcriptional regulator
VVRFRQDSKIEALRRSPLFEGMSRRQLASVARLTDDLEVPAGTLLCKQGTRGQEFFVIIDGEATVTRDGEDLATVRSGEFFGEIALLQPVKRTATVTAATPLRLFVVSRQAFDSVVEADPAIERKLLRTVVRRLASDAGDPTVS